MKYNHYRSKYIKPRKAMNGPWYMNLRFKESLCIMATLHLIFLYFFCNGVPLVLWNIVWQAMGLRPIPI